MPRSTVIPSFACWLKGMKQSKWPDGSFNLTAQQNHCISWWKYFSFGIEKSKSSEYDITGAVDKNFACVSLGVILNGVTLSYIPWSWTCEFWTWENTQYIGQWFRICMVSWRTCSSPASYCHPVGSVTKSWRGYPTILSNPLLQNSGEYVKTCEFQWLDILLGCSAWRGSLGIVQKDKSVSRVSVPERTKGCMFYDGSCLV